MIKKLSLVCLILILLLASIVFASEERYTFLIDEEGNTKLRYQAVLSVSSPEMYLPGFTMTLSPPVDVSHLEFYDSNGKINPRKAGTEEGYDIYKQNIPDIDYNQPYQIGYQYDLPEYTTVRYNENYHFEYPFSPEEASDYVISVCIPSSANVYPVDYDSSPETQQALDWDSYKPVRISLPYIPIGSISPSENYRGDFSISPCPSGYQKTENYESNSNQKITSSFSIPNNRLDLFTFEAGKIKLTAPKIYQTVLEKNVKNLQVALPNIESKLNLNPPYNYNLYLVSDTDKVFLDAKESNSASLVQDDGTVYYKISLLNVGDDEFIQINLLRALINSASLNTYGENSDNSWWSHGALTNMALRLMKESNLPYNEVQKTMNEVKDQIKLLSTNEIIALMNNVDSEEKILIYSSIVDEIDTNCPDHVLKLNKRTREMSDLSFTSDKQFNNFLIYNLKEECPQVVETILDKYQLGHDNVQYVSGKYSKINEKIANITISRKDIIELNDARSDLQQATNDLQKGNTANALVLIENAEKAYTQILDLVQIYSKVENLRPKLDAIPVELRSAEILTSINKIDEAEDLVRGKNTTEALLKVNEALFFYDENTKKTGGVIQEYVDAKIKTESVSNFFYLPAKPFAKNSLSSAADLIKNDDYTGARNYLSNSNFWSNSAFTLALVMYTILIGLFIMGYLKIIKPRKINKFHEKHAHPHKEN